MNLLAFGSIPVDGSSIKTIGGFPIIAIATDSFHLFPPLSLVASTNSYSFKFISDIYLLIIVSLTPGSIPLMQAYRAKCSLTVIPLKRQSN